MKQFRGYPVFSILFLFCFRAVSQGISYQDTLSFQHIKTGMSQSSATQILQDRYGFLWIGTPNGINKYDGTSFQVFEKSPDGITGLTDGYIESIYEDSEGQLYIGTNQGLNLYDRKLNLMKPYPFEPQGQMMQSQYIGAIGRSNDVLWLGTSKNGVYKYNIKSGEIAQLRFDQIYEDGPNNNYIVEVFPLSEKQLLVVTQACVYLISEDLQILSQAREPQDISSAIMVDQDHFWLGSHHGEIIQLKIAKENSLALQTIMISPGYSILSLEEDMHGNIWVGSENDGLSIYSPFTEKVLHLKVDVSQPGSIPSNSIWSLHKASNGVMWVGPFKQGLSFYDPKYYKFTHIKTDPFNAGSLSNNIVNCFAEDKNGNIWIGTDGGGLNYWNRKQNSFEHYSLSNGKLNSNVVLSLFQAGQDRLWIGTWARGLTFFDLRKGRYTNWNRENSFLGSNHVIAILQDKKSRIWIGTLFGGIHLYYPASNTHRHIRLESEIDGAEVITVARLLEDKQGHIWVGTQLSGLFRLVEKDTIWELTHYHSLNEASGVSNDFINMIIEDDGGTIWVGTQAGLNQYQAGTNTFKSITKADGLKDDAIKGIIEDEEGFLWLSTGKGIIRYDPATGQSLNYDLYDGLQGDQFNAAAVYVTSKGEFLFGGSNGFNILTTDQAEKREDKPGVYLYSLKIFNQPVYAGDEFGVLQQDISQTDSVTFTYKQSVINFEFRALTYRHPDKVNYAYFLEGFESEWNYVGNNPSATYTNLSPGRYTLRIKSTNSDGVWNDQETTLAIRVTPPYWSTWWFRTLIIILMVVVIYVIYLVRIRNIKKYQAELERQISERTRELRLQKEKLVEAADELSIKNEEIQRFAFAVSHDLKSPLNNIKGIAGLIPMEIDLDEHPEIKNYLNLIGASCTTMSDLITDITKIARLGKIENKQEWLDTHEIVQSAIDLVIGGLKERPVKLVIAEDLPGIFGDRNRMIQVFENLIDNAIKYMGDQKEPIVHIEAKENGREDQFLVKDNGSGMDANALKNLFAPFERFDNRVAGTGLGLYMIKKIIESHNGHIQAGSEGKGKGTTFVISLPRIER